MGKSFPRPRAGGGERFVRGSTFKIREKMIKVLIVDDSAVARIHLWNILESDPDTGIRVIGMAKNGEEAVRFAERKRPDVITMDIAMPVMNGLDATRRIMETTPVPIVIISASCGKDVENSFLAMQAGAVAVLEKPAGEGSRGYEEAAKEIVQTVKLMSEVRVVRRWPKAKVSEEAHPVRQGDKRTSSGARLIAIGASTGGPPVLQTILSSLPKDFPVPILIVQHIAKGFLGGMVDWLRHTTLLSIRIASHGERLLPGHVYFAPDDFHAGVTSDERISLSRAAPENGLRPSVSYLFRSVADTYSEGAVGVLLTGMGRDGAEDMKLMKERGAVTIAQDQESSVVFGMPGEAVRLDAATHVLPPERIPAILKSLIREEPDLHSHKRGEQ